MRTKSGHLILGEKMKKIYQEDVYKRQVYIGAVLGGIGGAYIGRKILKKHFIKAGIV